MSITCPRCGMTSYNPNDEEEGYCGNCHWWTSDPHLGGYESGEQWSQSLRRSAGRWLWFGAVAEVLLVVFLIQQGAWAALPGPITGAFALAGARFLLYLKDRGVFDSQGN